MKAEKFEDLVIFQKARELCKDVYRVTSNEPWKYDSRFVQQIHAAAGSIMDNIAEGYERDGAPVLIWHVLSATARSAIVVSAVSPERCELIAVYPAL